MCTDSGLGRLGRLGQSAFTGKSATVNRLCSVGFSKQVERSWSVQRLCKYFQLLTGKYSKRRVITKKKKKSLFWCLFFQESTFNPLQKPQIHAVKTRTPAHPVHSQHGPDPSRDPISSEGPHFTEKLKKNCHECKKKMQVEIPPSPLIAFRFPLSSDQRITDFLK